MVIYRGYKTELMPTAQQANKMIQNMGVCRFLYNEYLNMNARLYKMYLRGLLDKNQDSFISAIDFDKYVNRKLKVQPEYSWINLCGSKARKKALMNAQAAYRNYFSSKSLLPKFKCRYKKAANLYFPRNNATDWQVERWRVKVPTFGMVRLKECGYLPVGAKVVSGTISYCGGRFYISLQVQEEVRPIGPSMGQLEVMFEPDSFISCSGVSSGDEVFERIAKAEHKLRRLRRSLQRKLQNSRYSKGMERQHLQIEKLHRKIHSIKMDYIHKLCAQVLKLRPKRIVIVKGSSSARSKKDDRALVAKKRLFYVFCEKLMHKAQLSGVETMMAEPA